MGLESSVLLRFDSVTSTQDVARELARSGSRPGTAIMASEQTAGRGRMGRPWTSPRGMGLYLSIILDPPVLGPASLAAGLAVRDGILAACRLPEGSLWLKWPNDVVAKEGRKLAGILLEVESGPEPVAVLGVGINMRQEEADFPQDLRGRATSLWSIGAWIPEAEILVESIRSCLRAYLDELQTHGFERLHEAWLAASIVRPGHRIEIRDAGAIHDGTFEGLSTEGALLLRQDDGAVREIRTGDVGA